MKNKIILLFALFTLSVSSAFAHALWIETAQTGKKGAPQTVKVFFGEYESGKPDTAKTWFSNMTKFKLVLTAPDGKTQVLKTTAALFFYQATFTPSQDGIYLLSVVHEVADIYDNAKIEYYAFADVAVGNASKLNGAHPTGAQLAFLPTQTLAKNGSPAGYQVVWNKTAFAKQKIAVINPANKKEEIETDEKGKLTLKTVQKGNYFLEAFYEDKTPGTLGTKKYEKVWHVATYFTKID